MIDFITYHLMPCFISLGLGVLYAEKIRSDLFFADDSLSPDEAMERVKDFMIAMGYEVTTKDVEDVNEIPDEDT